jgi:hypothetical protein
VRRRDGHVRHGVRGHDLAAGNGGRGRERSVGGDDVPADEGTVRTVEVGVREEEVDLDLGLERG